MIFDSDSDQVILNPPWSDEYLKSITPIYQFQCNRCFIVSGHVSRDSDDGPACCGGELMVAIKIGRR